MTKPDLNSDEYKNRVRTMREVLLTVVEAQLSMTQGVDGYLVTNTAMMEVFSVTATTLIHNLPEHARELAIAACLTDVEYKIRDMLRHLATQPLDNIAPGDIN